jgi:Protein of unknown function (DUF2726)
MHDDEFRKPILVNEYEQVVDTKLAKLCERYGARLLIKVGLKEVLPINGSGLDDEDFSYALMAHFDFVLADETGRALLAVEFDGRRHRSDPKQRRRDEKKNRICEHFFLPLIRAGAPWLREADHRTLLEWIIEIWFEHRRLCDQKDAMDEEDWDGDPPEFDPDDFDYTTAYATREEGLQIFAPLDAFREARERIGRWYWSRLGRVEYRGWYQEAEEGHHVGLLALEVEPGAWLTGVGQADLRGLYLWSLTGVDPPTVAQDIALLDLSRQLAEWDRGRAVAISREGLDAMSAGMTRGELTWFAHPARHELMSFTRDHLRRSGVDVDDPRVMRHLRRCFSDDDEERELALTGEDDWWEPW